MKMKKSQFREDAATYIQMIHLLNEYNPGWKIILIGVLLEGIFPFIAIFLSSMLLDALYSGRSMQEMALLVLAGTGASFVTAILRHLVTKKKNIMWWGMQHRMTEPIMTKTMQMDYEQIGDERVRTLRARQDEYRKREKDVFERFLTQLEILLTAAVRMVAAIITIGPFFAKQFSKTAGTQETLFRIIAIAALFAVLYLNRRSVLEQGKRRLAIHKEHEDENRLNSYMMNEVVLSQKAGKDIRIFHQEPMMEHYGDQMNANWRRMTLQYAKNDVCHFGLQGMLSSCVGGIIYLYVAFCAYGGMITIGNVVRYAGAVQQFIQGMTDLFAGWSRLHHDRMQMDEYLEYMGLQNKMKKASRPVSLADMENPEVEFVDVSFRYPGTEQYVLRDVNVKISARESTAFVGLNGSGKTTTINLISGALCADDGCATYKGNNILEYKEYAIARQGIKRTFQNIKLFPSLSVIENVMLGGQTDDANVVGSLLGLKKDKQKERLLRERAQAAIEYISMTDIINRNVGDLPYGKQKKLEFARAMVSDPDILLLDEPATGLNPTERTELVELLEKIKQDKYTILIIEHNMDVVMNVSDKIYVLNFGTKIAEGKPHEIQTNKTVIEAYLGEKYQRRM